MSTLTAETPASRSQDARVFLVFVLWFSAALAAAALGVLSPQALPLVPISIFGGATALVIAYRRVPAFRAFAQRIDLRIPIVFHVLRLPIGVLFLAMMASGELDPTFARIAGWGDIVAGALAIAAALAVPAMTPARRALVHAWNAIGMLDILVVIATAQSILFLSGHPETMFGVARFPWASIPTFVVPVVIATHLLVFARLREPTARGARE